MRGHDRMRSWRRRLVGMASRHMPGRARGSSDDWFRTLVESSPQAILIHDGRTRLFCNDAYAGLLGYPDTEAVLRAGPVGQKHLFPADHDMLQVIWRDILDGRQTWSQKR